MGRSSGWRGNAASLASNRRQIPRHAPNGVPRPRSPERRRAGYGAMRFAVTVVSGNTRTSTITPTWTTSLPETSRLCLSTTNE